MFGVKYKKIEEPDQQNNRRKHFPAAKDQTDEKRTASQLHLQKNIEGVGGTVKNRFNLIFEF